MNKILKRVISLMMVMMVLGTVFTGCGKKDETDKGTTQSNNESSEVATDEAFEIDIMMQTFTGEPMSDDSPAKAALEAYTNTKLSFRWVPSSSYEDKFNITLASGEIPMLTLVTNKSSSYINAVRAGAFWEIGPYLADYPNLAKANENVLNNISVDGKVYGLYRSRPYARNGIAFRQDWLDNIGLEKPETIDDFYNMLDAFTNDDPDGNGENDTYGMAMSKWQGPFYITGIWFGTPNKWGEDEAGALEPDFMTTGYKTNLEFWKKMYDEGLINQDFAVLDPAKWTTDIELSKAGVIVDVSDVAQRLEQKIEETDPNTTAVFDVIPYVESVDGDYKNLPTSGYSGMYAISKTSVKTEEDLKRVLQFLNDINDKVARDIIDTGLEGRQYTVVDEQYIELISGNSDYPTTEINDLNQLGINIGDQEPYVVQGSAVREKIREIQGSDYDQYCVPNPAEPLISDTYSLNGPQLDDIIEDARVQYIVGQIDEAGFDEAVALWLKSGGKEVIEEMNTEYEKAK